MLPTRRTGKSAASIWADPFDLLHRDFDRMLSRYIGDDEMPMATASYPMDVWEDDDHLFVSAELPGFTRDQVNVTMENGVLTISAERKPDEYKTPHLTERRYTRVQRSMNLPISVDENKVDAKLDSGVLTLKLSKREEVKPRKIEVK